MTSFAFSFVIICHGGAKAVVGKPAGHLSMSGGSGTKLDCHRIHCATHSQEDLSSLSNSVFDEIVKLLILLNLDP